MYIQNFMNDQKEDPLSILMKFLRQFLDIDQIQMSIFETENIL